MLIQVCDKCHEKMENRIYCLRGWQLVSNGVIEHKVEDKEFCSLHCQQQYLIDDMKERNLGNGIKV